MSSVYDQLVSAWREEKGSRELTSIPQTLIEDLKQYVLALKRQMRLAADRRSVNAQLKDVELRVISNLLTDLLRTRAKKIIESVIDGRSVDRMLPFERELYRTISQVVKLYWRTIDDVVSSLDLSKVRRLDARSSLVLVSEKVPQVVDKEGRRHGPYLPGDLTTLPIDVLEALESRGSARVIS